nr:hypothetical protein [Tanacetum cinerariifolium]
TQFDLMPHMESPDWTEINVGIQRHLQKAYNTNNAAFKAQHWGIDPTIGTYNVEKIRRARPQKITTSEWDKYIVFWNDSRNITRAAQNRQNQAKSTVISQQGSRSLARLRDEMEEMRRLEATEYCQHGPQPAQVRPRMTKRCGDDEEVPTIRTTMMKMEMEILSCVIYGSFPDDMSPGNMCYRGTYFLTEKYVGPIVLLGIVAKEGIPYERFPANIPQRQVAEKRISNDKSFEESLELSLGKRLNVVV